MKTALIFLLPPLACFASQLHVPEVYPTIQGAIDAASPGDSVMIAPGAYTASDTLSGKSLHFIGEEGCLSTSLQSEGDTGPALYVCSPGQTVYLEGLTFTTNWSLRALSTSMSIEECSFSDRYVGMTATTDFHSCPSVAISGCLFENNEIVDANWTGGAAFRAEDCISVDVENCFFRSNRIDDRKNGLATPYGGAVFASGSGLEFTNCCFWQNRAGYSGYGSAVYVTESVAGFVNCTFSGQLVGNGMSIYCDDSEVEVRNCILWETYPSLVNAGSVPVTVLYSDIQPGGTSGPVSMGAGNIESDPMFWASSYCPYHLATGSPCIDAGDPAPAYYDPEDPAEPGFALWPAMGTVRNDMGAFGGNGAFFWYGLATGIPGGCIDTATIGIESNPSFGQVHLSVGTAVESSASIDFFDMSGRIVASVDLGNLDAGTHMVTWTGALSDGSQAAAGVYFARLRTASGGSQSVRLVYMR
ncbi:MAG: FlgD immunoglobulin-like domain containing protein [Candidatus Fermentibacter sp.]|nr:FlgD immunoglobulin-like domain containing protein [Candidatus Fermentibacter sp.]